MPCPAIYFVTSDLRSCEKCEWRSHPHCSPPFCDIASLVTSELRSVVRTAEAAPSASIAFLRPSLRRSRSFRYRETATRSRSKNSVLGVPSLPPSLRLWVSVGPPSPSPVERKSGYFLEISPPQTQHNAHPVSLNQMYSADRHSTVAQCWDGMNPSFRPFAKQALRTTQVCARIDCTA